MGMGLPYSSTMGAGDAEKATSSADSARALLHLIERDIRQKAILTREAFEEAVEDYLASCARLGREPQRPYSGRFNIRIPADLHARAATRAAERGISLNKLVEQAIAETVSGSD